MLAQLRAQSILCRSSSTPDPRPLALFSHTIRLPQAPSSDSFLAPNPEPSRPTCAAQPRRPAARPGPQSTTPILPPPSPPDRNLSRPGLLFVHHCSALSTGLYLATRLDPPRA
ncbi:hypothetical protein LMH87_001881 [Akanthomyces muscarius]|uniref:Uncharacterized protein n=1 Tax=Akanthomyces muscarius TaxID=2231603 RepID=A0A9W8UIP1_AKAMU|nr:hypothetical protein LMH87_001881 [Akanthomyces muscarius]KAJ4147352.1 hypothetical protein LMH87_001881 [Akanthomyces muscarius]